MKMCKFFDDPLSESDSSNGDEVTLGDDDNGRATLPAPASESVVD